MSQDDLTVRLQSARQLLAAGSLSDALTALNQLRRDYPRDPDILAALAVAHANSGNLAEAVEYLNASIVTKPNARSYYNLAMVFRQKGDDVQAAWALEQALDLEPNYDRARQLLYQMNQGSSAVQTTVQPPAAC